MPRNFRLAALRDDVSALGWPRGSLRPLSRRSCRQNRDQFGDKCTFGEGKLVDPFARWRKLDGSCYVFLAIFLGLNGPSEGRIWVGKQSQVKEEIYFWNGVFGFRYGSIIE